MNTVLARLALLMQLLPALSKFITEVESMFPQGGAGQAKLEAVRQMLEAAFAGINGLTTTFEEVWPLLHAAIGSLVNVANTLRVFGHGGQPAIPQPVPAAPVTA